MCSNNKQQLGEAIATIVGHATDQHVMPKLARTSQNAETRAKVYNFIAERMIEAIHETEEIIIVAERLVEFATTVGTGDSDINDRAN